jgi:DNA-binding transcriptional MerR regulator
MLWRVPKTGKQVEWNRPGISCGRIASKGNCSVPAQRDAVLLTSWKEVAAYMGRSIRTVQRWEKFGLPVRRLTKSSRSSVLANSRDIDIWLANAHAHGFATKQSREQIFLRGALAETLAMHRVLQAEMAKLRDERHEELRTLKHTLQRLIDTMTPKDATRAKPQQAISKYRN